MCDEGLANSNTRIYHNVTTQVGANSITLSKAEYPACTLSCQRPLCGDGKVNTLFEQCDDGNADQMDSCTNDCLIPVCGDGVQNGSEECEQQNPMNLCPRAYMRLVLLFRMSVSLDFLCILCIGQSDTPRSGCTFLCMRY